MKGDSSSYIDCSKRLDVAREIGEEEQKNTEIKKKLKEKRRFVKKKIQKRCVSSRQTGNYRHETEIRKGKKR